MSFLFPLLSLNGTTDNGNRIEGVVFKRVDDGTISFKKVSAKYLLKSED